MTRKPHDQDLEQQLASYFDGELTESDAEALTARLEQEDALSAQLEDMRFMREIVVGALESEARAVPEARFEQVWDEVSLTIDRDARESSAKAAGQAANVSIWERFAAWMRPVRLPVGVAAAAGAVALVVLVARPGQDGASSGEGAVASEQATPPGRAQNPESPEPSLADPATQIAEAAPMPAPEAEALPVPLPAPESNDADIERIEFGGASGRISHIEGVRGTTTVIWVEEEDEPADSERSL